MIRAAALALALAASAWFAIGIRQARDTSRAETFVTTHKTATPREARRVESLLRGAAFLNPDQTVTLLRGRLASERGEARRAEQIIIPVTRAEPQNLDGWLSLAYVSGHDPALFARALAEVKRLDPRLG